MSNSKTEPVRILLIGPLPPPIGGTRVSFRHLTDYISLDGNIDAQVVNMRPIRQDRLRGFFQIAAVLSTILYKRNKYDVISLHCNSTALLFAGLVVCASRMAGRPLVLRTFGGIRFLDENGYVSRLTRLWALRNSALYLAQTRAQVEMTKSRELSNVRWYPTNRPMPPAHDVSEPERNCRRFVYCGHVRPFKGIFDLIQAAEALDSGVVVDVYGPFLDGLAEDIFRDCNVVRYRGELAAEDVVPVLKNYDAMVLPTRATTEGYPGTILEAYCAGIPVIASRCGAIPEIVGPCGILVESGNPEALHRAMETLMSDPDKYTALREAVFEHRGEYALDKWGDRFIKYCTSVARGEIPEPDPNWSAG